MENLRKRIRKNFSWCKIPFTYGEAIQRENIGGEVDEDWNNISSLNYNGSIASVQLFGILIAVSSSMTISALLSDRFDPSINMLTLIVYMVVGCLIMVLLHIHRNKVLAVPLEEDSSDPTRDNLTLIGMSIFYIFSCFMDVFQIVAGMGCIEVWRSYGNGRGYSYFTTSIAFHVARVVYLGGETVFCINLNRSTFLERSSIRYALIFLQAANLSLWFDAMVSESISSENMHPILLSNITHVHPGYGPNVSGHVMDCINFNTSVYQMAKTYVSPAFLPFTIEFTLLVGECFAHWFFSCSSSKLGTHLNSSLSMDTLLHHENIAESTQAGKCESLERMPCLEGGEIRNSQTLRFKETAPIQHELVNMSSVTSEIGDIASNRVETEEHTPLLSLGAVDSPSAWRLARIVSRLWLLFVVSLNLLLFIFAILYKFKLEEHELNSTSGYFLGFVWFSLILAIGFAYFVTRSHRTLQEPFSGLDYLLVWSSFGPIAHCFFNCIAAVALNHHGNGSSMRVPEYGVTLETFVLFQVLNVFEIYFQLSFSLYACRLVVDGGWRGTIWRQVVLKGIVLYLAATNGSMWVIGTIHSFDFGQLKDVNEGYFGRVGWRIVNNIVSPLLLFFRFNSCLILTRTYRRLRRSVP